MRLIHDDHIPTGFDDLLASRVIAREESYAGETELGGGERILFRFAFFAGEAATFIEDGEPEIESTEEFDEPLVHERFGHKDQSAFSATGG